MKDLLQTLQDRFEKNVHRHPNLRWSEVANRLADHADKLAVLAAMESTGGEPDVIGRNNTGQLLFADCAKESPNGRRSTCYDPDALESRKKHKPAHSAIGMAAEMGSSLLDEEQYQALQALEDFDMKTSSWLATPANIRSRGGALFGDRRFGRVFTYHNGAESYYAARGFRTQIEI